MHNIDVKLNISSFEMSPAVRSSFVLLFIGVLGLLKLSPSSGFTVPKRFSIKKMRSPLKFSQLSSSHLTMALSSSSFSRTNYEDNNHGQILFIRAREAWAKVDKLKVIKGKTLITRTRNSNYKYAYFFCCVRSL
jgi:hypothetical protein